MVLLLKLTVHPLSAKMVTGCQGRKALRQGVEAVLLTHSAVADVITIPGADQGRSRAKEVVSEI